MRKTLFTIVMAVVLMGLTVNAQEKTTKGSAIPGNRPTPEQMVEWQAARIASELALGDDATARFISTYKAFKTEQAQLFKDTAVKPAGREMTEAEVEAKIKADFERSYKTVELREKYYYEFRTFMNPKQIQKMYSMEKRNSNSASAELHRRQQVQGHNPGQGYGGGHQQGGFHGSSQGGHSQGRPAMPQGGRKPEAAN